MTQEEKQPLLTDLCGRVPYHPKGKVVNNKTGAECDEWLTCATFNMFTSINNNCRLYLRPMSSMTEKELKEYGFLLNGGGWGVSEELITNCIDWLNAHHFDYRGLIPMGLALEAPEGIYGKGIEK